MPDDLLAGRYQHVKPLGSGAMGDVWLAEDVLLHRRVAVKRVRQWAGATDPHALERMVREARLAARLDHPNAVVVHDLVVIDDVPHVIMQYVPGRSLGSHIAEAGQLHPDEAGRIIGQVAGALAQAHALGIVHRDVKPANILLNEHGQAKLADFGIARSSGDGTLTQTGAVIGTPAYLAPEIVRGESAGPESDVYALGATLYTAVEGRPPFGGGEQNSLAVLAQVLTQAVRPPVRAGPLAALLMDMLAAEPARRPSAVDVETQLRAGPQVHRPRTDPEPRTLVGRVPYTRPPDMTDPIRAAIDHTDAATGGWSGGFEEWEDVARELARHQLHSRDQIALFLPTLFGLDPAETAGFDRRMARSLKSLRAGATIVLGDRMVFVWSTSSRSPEQFTLTIPFHEIVSVDEIEFEEDGEDFNSLVIGTPRFRWPVLFSNQYDLSQWRHDLRAHLSAIAAANRR
jgi:serine/threonine protein kinase